MMTAAILAKMMQETFGPVIYACIDQDAQKYPMGSGRVTFEKHESYKKAVEMEFIKCKTPRFEKRIQIDPFIQQNQKCEAEWKSKRGGGYEKGCNHVAPLFCRQCFQFYCDSCYESSHSGKNHRRVRKQSKSA